MEIQFLMQSESLPREKMIVVSTHLQKEFTNWESQIQKLGEHEYLKHSPHSYKSKAFNLLVFTNLSREASMIIMYLSRETEATE